MTNNSYFSNFYNNNKSSIKKENTLLEKVYLLLKKYELHRIDAVVELTESGNKILDIGVGNGDLLLKASKKAFTKLYGIDVSNQNIKKTKNNIKANLSVQNIDIKTSFKSNSFDVVTLVAVLEHVFNVNFVLKEVNRILKKGGKIIIEVPNLAFLPRRLEILFGRAPRTGYGASDYDIGHLHYFTQDSLKKLLEKHGFKVIYQGQSGIFWKLRQLLPNLLGANIIVKAVKI
jgi:methionine biosynthesis protein MetW